MQPAPVRTVSSARTKARNTAESRANEPAGNPKNIGGRPNVPLLESSETLVPKSRQTARSTKSTLKRAELQARLELQKKQLEAARTAVALAETELEITQCESEEELDEEELERSTHVEQWVKHAATYLEEPQEPERQIKSDLKELAEAIVNATRTVQPHKAPAKAWELPEFNGTHEDWLPFKRSFEDSKALCTDEHNMARLRKAVKGIAKEAVRGLLFVASDPEEIIAALERRFGRPEQLVLTELQKIKDLPRVGDTPREICVFASRISNAVATISALKRPEYMYAPEICSNIVAKLSPILCYRWLDYSTRTGKEDPELMKIKKFLDIESELCGTLALPEPITRKRFGGPREQVHAAQEEHEEEEVHTTAAAKEVYKKFCFQCEGEHWLTECKLFKEATTEQRWETAKKKKLCFRCLRQRHMRFSCKGQACKKCKRPHHTLLHSEPVKRTMGPVQQQKTDEKIENAVKSVYATADGTKVYLKMIPVDVIGPTGSTRILALLDEGSTVSLLDASIAARIGATGKEESLVLETVGGKIIEKKNSQKMDLQIKGAHRRDERTLRGVRTIENLRLSPQYVDKRAIDECNHLKNLKNELLYEKEKPGLLIGQDNWDLIVSRKIVKGKQNEPAASLTRLGWVLHGCCSGTAAAPVKYVNHCRSTDSEGKIEEHMKRHFELEAIGIQPKLPSYDTDGRALAILEETTKREPNGRFESGLLWKTENETLPTGENPADDATRDMSRVFVKSKWFAGPKFLREPDTEWPAKRFEKIEVTGEEKKSEIVATARIRQQWETPDPDRFSNWTRLVRATARVFMFIELCRIKKCAVNATHENKTWKPYAKNKKKSIEYHPPQLKETRKMVTIPDEHLQKAEMMLLKRSQEDSFTQEIASMKRNAPLEGSSQLKKLDVHLDEHGVLRLNSRTTKIRNIGTQERKLAVLNGRHKITHLLIDHYHRKFCHGNHATVINELRQKYWILSLRNSVKKILHQCQWCRVRKMKPEIPPMGDLPEERLQHDTYPFVCTAVDYFGPMHVTIGRRREKRWGALFTCLTTRAVHLELAASLSTSSMIMALRRMAARRGSPRVIYSDNGTNFVGADHELRAEAQKINKPEIVEAAEKEGIRWKFIPPGAPHMGGAWERMVRTVKVSLSAVLNERSPPEEVLHTLLTEVEHTVNSRPLTHLSNDPQDEESLTPNHFLIGRSCGSAILGEFSDTELIGKANWKTAQRLADHFWRRWLREYLPTLMPRRIGGKKTTDPQRGDIVIIADTSLPRNTWPRGEVVKIYGGPDGRTRVVDVRTAGGVLRRPTSRLIVVVPAASRPEEEVHE